MDASCREARRPRFRFLSIAFLLGVIFSSVIGNVFIVQQSTYAESLGGAKLEAVSFYNDEGLIAVRDANRDEQDMTEGGGSSNNDDNKSALEKIEDKFADLKEKCMTSGAASSIGWILCPVMTWLASTASYVYDSWVVPRLQVDTDILKPFAGGGESSVKGAWNTFRNFANIAFVILFAVVILSQITGIGINNYGIKKILPKLIVAAVIVNLSYYIVLIAVDVSNIIGVGAKGLFDSLAEQVAVPSEYSTEFGNATGVTLLTGVGILAVIGGGVASIALNPAILLSLFIGVVGLVISLFTLLVMLAAREVIIVILVVVSPVALVCFMLPNTKKIFDKWFKIIEAMLLVFPISGFLMGAGNYVSKLILASHSDGVDFVTGFIAMLASIVPIFFIPKVLKSSFDGVGKLGAKISDYGKNIRGRTQGAMANSNIYKGAQRQSMERRTRISAGVDASGNLTKAGQRKARFANSRLGKMFGADRAMASNLAAAKKDLAASDAAGATLVGALARTGIPNAEALEGGLFDAGSEGAYYGKMFLAAAQKGSETDLNASIEAMRASNMKPKDIAKLMRYAENNDMFRFKDDASKAAWLRETSKKYGGDFLSTDMELGVWAKTGGSYGTDTDGKPRQDHLGEFGHYAETARIIGYDDIKPEDIARLSGDSMAGMAHSGLLDASMASSVLASNPNLSADKKIMLSAIANGVKANEKIVIDESTGQPMKGSDGKYVTTAATAQEFKDAVKAAMSQQGGLGDTFMLGDKVFNLETRNSWTASQPQAVNLVDVDSNGLVVPHGGPGTGGGGTS